MGEAMDARAIYQGWTSQASHLIGDLFDHAKPMIDQDYEGLPPLVCFVAGQLFIDCHLSSESVLLLVREEKEWDADLVLRSVLEGSLKLTYMLCGTSEEISAKVEEYWHVLPLFSAIRHSENARRALGALPEPTSPNWRPFHDLSIDTDQIERTRSHYSRRARRELKERWSFSGICKSFTDSHEPGLRAFAVLAHGYAMSSHLLHKDGDGVAMVWDRYMREPERQIAVKMGHVSRVVLDVCTFASLRLYALLRACGKSSEVIRSVEARYEDLFAVLRRANEEFCSVEYDRTVFR